MTTPDEQKLPKTTHMKNGNELQVKGFEVYDAPYFSGIDSMQRDGSASLFLENPYTLKPRSLNNCR